MLNPSSAATVLQARLSNGPFEKALVSDFPSPSGLYGEYWNTVQQNGSESIVKPKVQLLSQRKSILQHPMTGCE